MKRPNKIARALIDATVDRGLKEVAEDPKRSIRKLTDLGKQFSKARFLEEIYSIMQDLLRNDNSPYYTAIENLLRYTTRENLKVFGVNIGYNSLTFGGKLIRDEQTQRNYYTPWALTIRIAPDTPRTLSVSEIENCIDQGRPLGIYTYIIHYSGSLSGMSKLLELIARCRDCSFFLFFPDQKLDAQHLDLISTCPNLNSLLPADGTTCQDNVELLRQKKCLYSVYFRYSDTTFDAQTSEESMWKLAEYKSGFVIATPEAGCSQKTLGKAAKFCNECRVHPSYPFILFDSESGVREVDHIISANSNYFEILENGDLRTQAGIISDFRHTIDLEQILQIALPKDPS